MYKGLLFQGFTVCGAADDEIIKPETITSLFDQHKWRSVGGKPKMNIIEKRYTGKEPNMRWYMSAFNGQMP